MFEPQQSGTTLSDKKSHRERKENVVVLLHLGFCFAHYIYLSCVALFDKVFLEITRS